MTLKGTKVRHKTLGVGIIEDDSTKLIISVRFHNAPGGEKCSGFMMPNAFKSGFLSAYDENAQKAIDEFIDEITCSICGKISAELKFTCNRHLCDECIKEYTEICQCCEERYLVDREAEEPLFDSRYNRIWFCPHCTPLKTFVCKKCGRTRLHSYLVNEKYAPRSSLLCKNCVKTCSICGEKLDDEHAHCFGEYAGYKTYYYCPDCWPDMKQAIEEIRPIENQPTPRNEPKHVAKGDVLYVYKGQIICRKDKHTVIAATGVLHTGYGKQVKLDIQYCTQCQRYLIDYTSYEIYRERYGVLIGNIKIIGSGIFDGDSDWAEESPLHLCGYSVSKSRNLSESTRHYILAKMIHDGTMTKTEVIRYLEQFINLNGMKYGNEQALKKWENDLDFVHKYKMDTQPEVCINSIEKY